MPVTRTMRFASAVTCSQRLPAFQSDTFSCIQYRRVISPFVSASQTFSGFVAM